MTDAQATALIRAIEHLSDYVDLRDKPNHPLYQIASSLRGIDQSYNIVLERLNEIAGELAAIRKNR